MSPKTKQTPEAKPQPAAPAPAAAVQAAVAQPAPSKQQTTISQLLEGWKAKGVDLANLEQKQDGKFINLVVADGWPVVAVGPTGGINLPAIRSYSKPFDAAMDGKALLEKQTARDQKKATAAAAPVVVKVVAVAAEAPKAVSPTQRKQKAHADIETKLQASA